jgi:hypothetical protein
VAERTGKARYIEHPTFDDDLRGFRQGFGGGWVTKVPHGSGMLYVHFREAGRADYINWLSAKRAGLYSIADDDAQPANIVKEGLLARVTLVNLSDKEYALPWTNAERSHALSLAMCQDLEHLWTPMQAHYTWDPLTPEQQVYFDSNIVVAPGGRKEVFLVFRPMTDIKEEVMYGMHIAMAFMTVSHDFGEGFMSTVKGPVPVPFPFFNPDAEVPNARVELEFQVPAGGGSVVMPPLQMVRQASAPADAPSFVTAGLVRAEIPPKGEGRFRVEALCSAPATAAFASNTLTVFRPVASGYRYPKGMKVTNPAASSIGTVVPSVKGWQSYTYRKETAAQEAWFALPAEKKMEHALRLTSSGDIGKRIEGIRIMGKTGHESALPHLLKLFDDPDRDVGRAARHAYANIRGMSREDELRMVEESRAFEEHIADIARRQGRVTYVNIRDSILTRTQMNINEGGETHVNIQDSIVQRSGIGGEKECQGEKGGYTGPPPPEDYQERLALYEKALKAALKDGKITPDEKRLLDTLRKKYGLSEDEHEMLLNMCK